MTAQLGNLVQLNLKVSYLSVSPLVEGVLVG